MGVPDAIITLARVLFVFTVGLSLLPSDCASQTAPEPAADSQPASNFEAASVKLSNPDKNFSTFNFVPSGLEITGGTLRKIMETAYDVRTFQILGGPAWMDADRYDIIAKNAHDDAALQSLSQQDRIKETRRRLQMLLAQRFQLKMHRETRDLSEYSLGIAKKGIKFREADTGRPGGGTSTNCGVMKGTATTMTNLAVVLSRQLNRPVIDNTHLTGRYDFELVWLPDVGCGSGSAETTEASGEAPDRPSIFTALQELGLKLDATKGPAEVVVVDHAEKPEGN